jgi:hypothetical protein
MVLEEEGLSRHKQAATMVLEEERRREGIDSMILGAVTGPSEQVAPCIRNALEVSAWVSE